MIDFNNLESYRENNRIEAKKALGGLPESIWETYSAFANTLGGIILLGVEEHKDKSLHTIDLPSPEDMIRQFWDIINNRKKVSVNILSEKNVCIKEVDGKRFIVITVPRAARNDKPVYIDGNPLTGSYRRNGEGDYKCSMEEVKSMLRDAASQSQDALILEDRSLSVFDFESIKRYRNRMAVIRPGHVWESLDNNDFLYKLGAIGRGSDGIMHPTVAGLLMFGLEYEIVKEFPNYFLDYREESDDRLRWTDRVFSSEGNWSGNLFDFYFLVYNKLSRDIKIPFKIDDGLIADDIVGFALREALANCLVNADYYGRSGVVIVKNKQKITFSNPGYFRLDIETAKDGGVSDPRNTNLIKMFNLISIGERAGNGIPNIYAVWRKLGFASPSIEESFKPERTIFTLPFFAAERRRKPDDKKGKQTINTGKTDEKKEKSTITEKTYEKKERIKTAIQKEEILQYLTDNAYAKTSDLIKLVGVKRTRLKEILYEMIQSEIVVAEGNNRNRIYKLKH